MKRIKSKKVIMAMSGGIDSSVAAALLKRAGFEVIGVFMKFWAEPQSDSTQISADSNADLRRYENRCCTPESEKRARQVAEKLGIPFYVFNFEKEFRKKVVDYFLKEEKAGLTPNPCVVCNKEIKFNLLFKKFPITETDFIATGHYARKKENKTFQLFKGKDKDKDQSYFLWQLNQKMVKKILFPVGDYTKDEVRKLAKKFKLPVLDIPESQEICFIATTMNNFLIKHLKIKPGSIVEQVRCGASKIVGRHQGLWFYTIGQRKGIKLSGGPFYVLDKDIKKNILIVTKNEKDLYKKELIAQDINWISGKEPKFPLKIKAKIRYRHEPASAVVTKYGNDRIKAVFSKPQRAITPGQSIVFYKGQEVLGGGVIRIDR